ncbi:MAG: cell division protein SepF [Promethearchaeota archaeon]
MGFFRRKRKNDTALQEGVTSTVDGRVQPQMYIVYKELSSLADVTPISEEVRRGNVVILDIEPLAKGASDLMTQLKRAVDQLRAVCYRVGGDIGQLGKRYILLTPTAVRIRRNSQGVATSHQSPGDG